MAELLMVVDSVCKVLNYVDFTSSSSSSSDSDMDCYEGVLIKEISKFSRKSHRKIKYYFEKIIPQYSDEDFRRHFRLTRTSVEELRNSLLKKKPIISKQRRPRINYEKAILLFLWVLSNQESFRGVADRFGLGKGHAHRTFISMCEDVSSLTSEFIKWPQGDELLQTLQEFEDLRPAPSFPGVVGCIDGTHIEVPGPKGNMSYYNRNKYHSVILQGVCNASGAFIDVYAGWPGSVHDARVWKHSPLFKKLENNILPENTHLLGDSAYPLAKYMMVPYKDNGFLTPKQKKFNHLLSSKRIVIENAFGRLKQLFRRLKYLNMIKFREIKQVILAACVLHNIATWQGLFHEEEIEGDIGINIPQIENDIERPNNNAAKEKRDEIADYLFN